MVPPWMVITSPGRCALPPGMFSADGSQPVTRMGRPSSAMAFTAPRTAAAPAMSDFISSMLAAGLIEMPPVSKVMPLPTSARCVVAPSGEYARRVSRGGLAEPMPTARMPPHCSSASCFSSQMVTSTGSAARLSRAASARAAGGSALGGVLTRSRVRLTPAATAVMSFTACFCSAVGAAPRRTVMLVTGDLRSFLEVLRKATWS